MELVGCFKAGQDHRCMAGQFQIKPTSSIAGGGMTWEGRGERGVRLESQTKSQVHVWPNTNQMKSASSATGGGKIWEGRGG